MGKPRLNQLSIKDKFKKIEKKLPPYTLEIIESLLPYFDELLIHFEKNSGYSDEVIIMMNLEHLD